MESKEPSNLIGAGIENIPRDTWSTEQSDSRIESVGKEFESVFLSLLMKEMRNTLEGGGFFGEESSDTYGGLFDLYLGQAIADGQPLGIGELVAKQYSKNQA